MDGKDQFHCRFGEIKGKSLNFEDIECVKHLILKPNLFTLKKRIKDCKSAHRHFKEVKTKIFLEQATFSLYRSPKFPIETTINKKYFQVGLKGKNKSYEHQRTF